MPFVVKLRAIALNVGRRLRNASQTPSRPEGHPAGNPVAGPTATSRGTAFAPHRGVLDPARSSAAWRPQPPAQHKEGFARQCTLQAVFDWYRGFLDGAAQERSSVSLDDNSTDDSGHLAGQQAGSHPPVPGFPQFARQVIDAEQDTVRVRFFYPGGREAGVLLLRPEGNRCVIEVPDGPLYIARQAAVLPDLTRDPDDSPAATAPTGEAE